MITVYGVVALPMSLVIWLLDLIGFLFVIRMLLAPFPQVRCNRAFQHVVDVTDSLSESLRRWAERSGWRGVPTPLIWLECLLAVALLRTICVALLVVSTRVG